MIMRGRMKIAKSGSLRIWSISAVVLMLSFMVDSPRAVTDEPLDRLLDAIAQVETRNDRRAVGDGGRAIGPYQIRRAYWEDGTRFLGVEWEYEEAFNAEKSREVVRAYLLHYGKSESVLQLARIHNGGPKGHEKQATLPYARKIQKHLEIRG
jgi:hypothetical protein